MRDGRLRGATMFTKNDRLTLVATALLGILLYAWLRFAADLEQAPSVEAALGLATPRAAAPGEAAVPQTAPIPLPDPTLRRVTSHDELVALLDARGLDGRLLTGEAADWYRERGFLGVNQVLGVHADNAPERYYETLDEATLQTLSDDGDAGATQTLARMAMFLNPFDGLTLYEKAAGQGSVYALIKVADVLNLFASTQPADYASEPELFRQLVEVQRRALGSTLDVQAYATALAALGDGGPPVIDATLLNWTAGLERNTPERAREYACRKSGEILIANSAARRGNGVEPLSTQPPPVFLAPPDLAERMPCTATEYPLVSLMNLEGCAVERVIDAAGAEANLYICTR